MRIALCCIGRQENRYINEFVNHYINLGFCKIYIYDNNQGAEEHFEDVLQDDIDKGFVEVVNFRDRHHCQFDAYNDCFRKHGKEYDWMLFCDCDEFLVLTKHNNIEEYLKDKEQFQCVFINWLIMTDNNLVTYEDKPLMERFTTPMPINKHIQYNFPDNYHIKSIVNGSAEMRFLGNPHNPTTPLKCCNASGKPTNNSPFQLIDYDQAYFKHFATKTIEEYAMIKRKRGYPDGNKDWFKLNDWIKRFFMYNEVTQEKLQWLKEHDFIK